MATKAVKKAKIELDELSLIKGSVQEITDGAELFSVTKLFKKFQPIFKKNSTYVDIIKVDGKLLMVSNMSSFSHFWIEILPSFSDNIFIQWLNFVLDHELMSHIILPVDTMTGLKDATKIDTSKIEITKDSFVVHTLRKIKNEKNESDEDDNDAESEVNTATAKKIEYVAKLNVNQYTKLPVTIQSIIDAEQLNYTTEINVEDYLKDDSDLFHIYSEIEGTQGLILSSPKKFMHVIFSKTPESISAAYNKPNDYGIGQVRITSMANGIIAHQQYSVIPILERV